MFKHDHTPQNKFKLNIKIKLPFFECLKKEERRSNLTKGRNQNHMKTKKEKPTITQNHANTRTDPTKYVMMSSCTIRLMMPTDQLFTTTDLVVSYVKKSMTNPQMKEPIAARQCAPESQYFESERKVQLRFCLQAGLEKPLSGVW